MNRYSVVIFDLDGTLLDSDEALTAPFLALGVPQSEVVFGPLLVAECERLGLSVDDYLAHYDTGSAPPYDGVEAVLEVLPRWGLCSNKHGPTGRAELARLGWQPEVARFADDFGGPKRLGPMLDAMGVSAQEALFVGDTASDHGCALAAGTAFAWAGWNPRAEPEAGALVLAAPADILGLVAT